MIILRDKLFARTKIKIDSTKVNHKLEYPETGSQDPGTTNVEYGKKPTKSSLVPKKKKKKENDQKLLRQQDGTSQTNNSEKI